jgi:hypothetical protein
MIRDHKMPGYDPFLSSLMARAAHSRLLLVAGLILFLWVAIAWAVALP